MNILSIDIGFVNPSFVVLKFFNNKITDIIIYENIKFNKILDSFKYLEYFFSLNINKVLIEKQYINTKNVSLMSFIYGYFTAKYIEVIIESPIAYLRKNKTNNSRSEKKKYSVNLINNILQNQEYEYNFKLKNSDICDAINIGLYYIYKQIYKNKNYENNFNIIIENICFKKIFI